MCGSADDAPPPASIPVELPSRRPADSSEPLRPQTKHRPQSSTRPQSHHRRPQSGQHKTRSGTSSSTRPPKSSSELKRHGSSRRGEPHARDRDRARHGIEPIQEYTEDKAIRNGVAELITFIDQHVVNFYPLNNSGYSGIPEMDDPSTRQPAIRRYIAQKVISSIVMVGRDSLLDITEIANEISDDLKAYSSSNGGREKHLQSLCKLGDKLRRYMEGHPSDWEFGSFESGQGFIVLAPELYRDGEEVVPKQRYRVS